MKYYTIERESVARVYFGSFIFIQGLVTMFVPDKLILVPSLQPFFGNVPRWVWGLTQILAALMVVIPLIHPTRYRRTLTYPAVVCAVVWAGIIFYPYTLNRPFSLPGVLVWLFVGGVFWFLCLPEFQEKLLNIWYRIHGRGLEWWANQGRSRK